MKFRPLILPTLWMVAMTVHGAPRQEGGVEANHWAYQAPVRPELPDVQRREWPRNAVDYFVLAQLESRQLTPAPEAGPYRLVRRVYLDLTGIPPTPAQAEAFVRDASPRAYERLVDRLLASDQFGVRWARPWLDLARYADSHGFQRDDLRDTWPYRDWVVNALNRDMPYDRFTIEQLAGDLIPNAQLSQRIATGFNRCTTANVEAGTDQEEGRVNQVFDRVNTLGTVWLGITLECAQCHDHKYDPFTQADYYRLFAFFNNTPIETDFTTKKATASLRFTGPYLEVPDASVASRRAELQARIEALDAKIAASQGTSGKHNPESKELAAQRTRLAKQRNQVKPTRTLVMREKTMRDSAILKRGSFLDRGDPVQPGFPVILHPARQTPRSRLDLAEWLVRPENPLLARVTVNRWWAELFGRGLVATPEDFGLRSDPPSHPRLLDWLAVEFVDSGWSMKSILRTLVSSATYRQSSGTTQDQLRIDDRNRWLARGPRFRVDAEMIRDNALFAAGLLSLRRGGPPVYPFQPGGLWKKVGGDPVTYKVSKGEDGYRRGLYTIWKRASPYPSFINFDATSRSACVVQRSRSNTPLQALTLLNDPVYVEAAAALADRVLDEKPVADVPEQIDHAFRLCLVRPPKPAELDALVSLYRTQADKKSTKTSRSAMIDVATVLLNLDETITKN